MDHETGPKKNTLDSLFAVVTIPSSSYFSEPSDPMHCVQLTRTRMLVRRLRCDLEILINRSFKNSVQVLHSLDTNSGFVANILGEELQCEFNTRETNALGMRLPAQEFNPLEIEALVTEGTEVLFLVSDARVSACRIMHKLYPHIVTIDDYKTLFPGQCLICYPQARYCEHTGIKNK